MDIVVVELADVLSRILLASIGISMIARRYGWYSAFAGLFIFVGLLP